MELLQKTALQDRLRKDVNDLLGSTDERARNVTPGTFSTADDTVTDDCNDGVLFGTARPSSDDFGIPSDVLKA